MNFLHILALVVLAGCALAKPAEMERREEGDIGEGVIQPPERLLPVPDEDDDGKEKRGYYYYYYSSSSSSSAPNLKVVGPAVPDEIIDHADDGGTGKAPGCLPEYAAMPSPNTMCVYEDEPSVTEYGITRDNINLIVDMHNDFRAQEPSKDMTKMYWDDNIAVIAQKLAQSCTKGHDSNANRLVPDYNIPIGQSWCGGVKTWETCLALWHNEKDQWKYGKKSKGMIGHFTQIVNDKAVAIGCGFAFCPNHHRQNMVCNYAYGQTSKDMKKPYDLGDPCDTCPGYCKDGLCDCGSKVCKNNGKLNKSTCLCGCVAPYVGETCEEADCSIKEHRVCGTGDYVYENCKKYSNLPGMCPRECKICPVE